MNDFNYPDRALEKIADIFQAFSHPFRLKIIRELHDGARNVSELQEAIGGSQANVSKHLSTLRDQGIIKREKRGVESVYELADEDVREICDRVCSYFEKRISEQQNFVE